MQANSEKIEGKISCRSCDYYLGEISWLRKRNTSYFVRLQKFVDRVEVERYPESKMYHEIQSNGKVRCGDQRCRKELGGAQFYTDRPDVKEMCALQCKQLKFSYQDQNGQDRVEMFKKWTDVPFQILELELIGSKSILTEEL